MNRIVVEGEKPLQGELYVHGAKNSSLPILAASILDKGETVLHNCPNLTDVTAAIKILEYLGCIVTRQGDTLTINSDNIKEYDIPENLMHEMRSSIVFLGAIITRMKVAKLSFPGGCELGQRPIDLHISALKRLGVDIIEEYGIINCKVNNAIVGTKINLAFPSVGATENIMLAACMATGETIVNNAAQEPEIVDLANYLIARGANIKDAGKSTIIIKGVTKLTSCEYKVMPDRIVAATMLCCAAITVGELTLKNICSADLESVVPIFEQIGAKLSVYKDTIYIKGTQIIKAVNNIRTMPYPGFPTDAQAPIMAMLTKAKGSSIFIENIFESRYKHVSELVRMGANIKVEGKVCVVTGVDKLYGASVEATDLRGGAAMVVAALAAKGTTKISEIHHIERGYEDIVRDLKGLGITIRKEKKRERTSKKQR